MTNRIYFGDTLNILETRIADNSVNLIYVKPPPNTKTAKQQPVEDHLDFLAPLLRQAHRVLAANGVLYFHSDYREVHDCRLLLDDIFGPSNFLNEIIWAYETGAAEQPADRWPAKHDNILLYGKDSSDYTFNTEGIRIPYMAPGLVGPEKASRGKIPTDTWWDTQLSATGVIDRIIMASSNPGEVVLDFFAGSGVTGESCLNLKEPRHFILIENTLEAMKRMAQKFAGADVEWIGFDLTPLQQG